MARKRIRSWFSPTVKALGAVALSYLLVLAAAALWARRANIVRLTTDKELYLHHELVGFELDARAPWARRWFRSSPPEVRVMSGGKPVESVGGRMSVKLKEKSPGLWSGRWPVPWNAPEGTYKLESKVPSGFGSHIKLGSFRIGRRRPRAIAPGFAALTFENIKPLKGLRMESPQGGVGGWRVLFDWAEYVGADAVWVLGGETPGPKGEVWVEYNFPMLPRLAQEARRRGLKFGVWVMCYLAMPGAPQHPRYEYAVDVENGRIKRTRSISLRDRRRPGDVAALLKRFRDIPGVDFLGLDYIRNAQGGYELAEDFYREMPGALPPPGWEALNPEEKIVRFAREVAVRRSSQTVEAWWWWRAHRVARIVEFIKSEIGEEKPLWAFTLGWKKGWEHGQDPIMMTDAGVDVDAVMLYESDGEQFDNMLREWPAYLSSGQAQIIVGDVLDDPLHQEGGPDEYLRRNREAIRRIYADGRAPGMFVHDLSRGLWGRLGPHTSADWLAAARSAVREFRAARQGESRVAGRALGAPMSPTGEGRP